VPRLKKHARHVTASRTFISYQSGLISKRSDGHDILHCGTASRASNTGAALSVAFRALWHESWVVSYLPKQEEKSAPPYHMLKKGVEYQDLGAEHFGRRDRDKMIQRLVRRINDLGCQVQLLPQAA